MSEDCNEQGSRNKDAIEVQNIFQRYGKLYRLKHRLPIFILKVMSAIENCRTAVMGGHIDVCNDCGHSTISYNSCRNRHCPKCQTLAKEKWIENPKEKLLNVGYFHVVFTIPDTINTIVFQNQKVMYNILFKAAAETLSELCSEKKYLGATVGFTSILHTWGQNLMHHPHIHCIVPGGGLNTLGRWVNSRKKFFIPVKVLSKKFRGKFLYYLRQAFEENKLEFYNDMSYLKHISSFNKFIAALYEKEWVTYCKPPFKNSGCVIEYLGRYTHKVAISNSRITSIENDKISFKWRDYKDGSKWKIMTISAEEFIRRFLIHILPPKFMKIRHYGILGNRNKTKKLLICKQLTQTPIHQFEKATTLELIKKITGKDISKCPNCGSDKIYRYRLNENSPPTNIKIS